MRSAYILAGATTLFATAGCGTDMTATSWEVPGLDGIDAGRWSALSERRLFFGHQSVGGNLMEGIADVLRDRPDIPLRIVETDDPGSMDQAGLYHARVGTNGSPLTKLEAFSSIVSHDAFEAPSIAMVKYCYVDVTPDLDPIALFERYRATIESLRMANPGMTFVHVTMPLTTDSGWLRHVVAVARGRFPVRERNYIREVYNDLLRTTYGGREPIFDLARYEAVGADGRAHVVEYRGRQVPSLAEEWTSDGGHLNEAGRRRMAQAFLATMAAL